MAEIFEFSKLVNEAKSLANGILKSVLDSKQYNANKTNEWIESISNQIINDLKGISLNFKYIVSTTIMQNVGAGVNYELSSYWDNTTDAAISIKYENESIIAICTVIGVAL